MCKKSGLWNVGGPSLSRQYGFKSASPPFPKLGHSSHNTPPPCPKETKSTRHLESLNADFECATLDSLINESRGFIGPAQNAQKDILLQKSLLF
ncbi:hypothetical protein Baya_15280 [Bagarius yarrelli]|uniref:Uncharacterized protein n=1 Tax=Bagarius yarrelli TaxID=175774 RepID=A0A556VB54_BAGYA|nr:hypothetical protein Baya_15280 [Bagarius yarrelli]